VLTYRSVKSAMWLINVSRMITLDKTFLTERVSRISERIMMSVEDGIRTVLAL
jgi:mRNA interferase MazF